MEEAQQLAQRFDIGSLVGRVLTYYKPIDITGNKWHPLARVLLMPAGI